MSRRRRNFTAEEKVKILREHLEYGKSTADICDHYRIYPTQFSEWKRIFFQNAASVFTKAKDNKKEHKMIEGLESDLRDRNEVIAELLQETLKLKKSAGAR